MGHLSVVIPPDIEDSVTEGSSAQEGGSIRLTCTATGVPPPIVMWRREYNRPIVFRHDGGRERKGELLFFVVDWIYFSMLIANRSFRNEWWVPHVLRITSYPIILFSNQLIDFVLNTSWFLIMSILMTDLNDYSGYADVWTVLFILFIIYKGAYLKW